MQEYRELITFLYNLCDKNVLTFVVLLYLLGQNHLPAVWRRVFNGATNGNATLYGQMSSLNTKFEEAERQRAVGQDRQERIVNILEKLEVRCSEHLSLISKNQARIEDIQLKMKDKV